MLVLSARGGRETVIRPGLCALEVRESKEVPVPEPERLSINRASREELIEAGVLPRLASRIVEHRAEHGPIRDENELYLLVRDNEIRLDQLLGVVALGDEGEPRQGYST
jgi:hypothetical protein